MLTETWLIDNINNNEFVSENYAIFRRDRNRDTSDKTSGGGVLIAAKAALLCNEVQEFRSSNAEDIWISISINRSVFYICCAYIPPNDVLRLSAFRNNVERVLGIIGNEKVVIMGDFNLPGIEWKYTTDSTNVLTSTNLRDKNSIDFIETVSFCNLRQFNNLSNQHNNLLDLVLTNFCDVTVNSIDVPILPVDPHHPPFVVTINCKIDKPLDYKPTNILLFKRADYKKINDSLSAIDWRRIFRDLHIEEMINKFYSHINNIIELHVPTYKHNLNDNYPPWFDQRLIRIMKEKESAHARYKKFRNTHTYDHFSVLRRLSKAMIKENYKKYLQKIQNEIPKNSKKFWSYIRANKNKNCIPSVIKYNNKQAADGVNVCKLFSDYFSSVYEPKSVHNVFTDSCIEMGAVNISNLWFDCNEIQEALQSLDETKGPGPDKIPAIFIKKCSQSLTPPLQMIFNSSITQGRCPTLWKTSYVIPVFKAGDKSTVTNYRPISLLCHFNKIQEKIIHKTIFSAIEKLLITQQHGFIKGRSVESNLLTYTNFILNAMNNKLQVDAIYTDLSKAFDKIDHSILLHKLKNLGIQGDLLRWMESYLSNRSQIVTVNGYSSDRTIVTSGVPQGSHLGPLFFIIFINDVYKCFPECGFILYADDLKIFRSIGSPRDTLVLQSELNNFSVYCRDNKLFLNVNKCTSITFSWLTTNTINCSYHLNNFQLKKQSLVKDLGVLLDCKLLFNDHIDYMCKKANRNIGFIVRSCRSFTNPITLKILYYSNVRSVLEFACVVWRPFYNVHIDRLERIQNRFVIYVRRKTTHLKLFPLYDRHQLIDLITLYKIVHCQISSGHLLSLINFRVPNRYTRNTTTFYTPHSNSNFCKHSPLLRICDIHNSLTLVDNTVDIFSMSLNQYKKCILRNSVQFRFP